MHEFQIGDTVTFLSEGKEYHGIVQNIEENTAAVYVADIWEIRKLSFEQLTFAPPLILMPEQVRQLCRYEAKWPELTKGQPASGNVFFEEPYTLTFDDVLTAVENIRASGDDNNTVKEEWYKPLYIHMFKYDKDIDFEENPETVKSHEYNPNMSGFLSEVFYSILEKLLYYIDEPICRTITVVSDYITQVMEEKNRLLAKIDCTDSEKELYVRLLNIGDRLKKANELELTLYRKFVDDLCSKDNIYALRIKGYGCYGGDSAYECDWNASLECVRKLFELTGELKYANTLGYIYYYGRCWDGVPQYEEAFKYFSIGAAGCYESRYKLADMFMHGYAVPKNTDIAYKIIEELYYKNLSYIADGQFTCKFADIALRFGSYMENGYCGYIDAELAYKYYLQADYAIRQRLQYNYYGDLSVADSIRQHLNSILELGIELGELSKPVKTAEIDLETMLEMYLRQYHKLEMKLKPLKNGTLKLYIHIAPLKDDEYLPELFITETKTGFCGLIETLKIKVKNARTDAANFTDTIYFDNLKMGYAHDSHGNRFKGLAFMLGDEMQTIIAGTFTFTSPNKTSGQKYRIASVYFTSGGKHYDYLLDADDVAIGDVVCVMTDRGKTEVTVAAISEKYESELALPVDKYKKILGKI